MRGFLIIMRTIPESLGIKNAKGLIFGLMCGIIWIMDSSGIMKEDI